MFFFSKTSTEKIEKNLAKKTFGSTVFLVNCKIVKLVTFSMAFTFTKPIRSYFFKKQRTDENIYNLNSYKCKFLHFHSVTLSINTEVLYNCLLKIT